METKPMSGCAEAIAPVLRWDLAAFHGLPPCTREELASALGTTPLPGEGRSQLGTPGRTLAFIVIPMAGTHRSAKVWVDGKWVVSMMIQLPPVPNVAVLFQALGAPAARLDGQWDVVRVLQGEWVWPDRGLTLVFDNSGSKVVRAYFYAPTSVADWKDRLRPADTVHERE
jgi:hypothetical protein